MTLKLSQAQRVLYKDRIKAHAELFAGYRHQDETPECHTEIISEFHSFDVRLAKLLDVMFRGGGKTTIAEEGVAIEACFEEFMLCLYVCSTLDHGLMRLHFIRRQFETNTQILDHFGDLKGKPWTDEMIELKNGPVIKAMGRGQAIRGIKAGDTRPDLVIFDDIEDKSSVRTEEGRRKTREWIDGELLPTGAPNLRVRGLCNDHHPEGLANSLDKPGSGWVVRRYPIITKDEKGHERSIWPARYPLDWCYKTREEMRSRGSIAEWNSNYMCSSENVETRVFQVQNVKVEPRARLWEPVYAMMYTRRKAGQDAIPTGFAAWSWKPSQLIVWEFWHRLMLPSEIVAELASFSDEYNPMKIGWDDQALWIAGASDEARIALVREPRDIMGSVRGLEVFFGSATGVIFTQEFPEASAQLGSFPHGSIEAPAALSYALHPAFQVGRPVYEDLGVGHIAPDLMIEQRGTCTLALNAGPGFVVGVLIQASDGKMRVLADWVRRGDPGQAAMSLIQDANMEAERHCKVLCPQARFDLKDVTGLIRTTRGMARAGGDLAKGREHIRGLMRQQPRGLPAFLVNPNAEWSLNALQGGDLPAHGLILESIEAFAGLLAMGDDESDESRYNAQRSDGTPFISLRPQHGKARAR